MLRLKGKLAAKLFMTLNINVNFFSLHRHIQLAEPRKILKGIISRKRTVS